MHTKFGMYKQACTCTRQLATIQTRPYKQACNLNEDILDLGCALLVAQFRFKDHRKDGNYTAEVGVAFTENVQMVRLHQPARMQANGVQSAYGYRQTHKQYALMGKSMRISIIGLQDRCRRG